jgi:hypothetical protein
MSRVVVAIQITPNGYFVAKTYIILLKSYIRGTARQLGARYLRRYLRRSTSSLHGQGPGTGDRSLADNLDRHVEFQTRLEKDASGARTFVVRLWLLNEGTFTVRLFYSGGRPLLI